MLLTMNGLVLRETQAGDKGRFIDILTEEYGVMEVFVRGAKKITGKSIGTTQLFSYASFCIEQRGERYYYQSARPIRIFYQLRENLVNLSLASYFSELIRTAVPKSRHDRSVLRLSLNTLYYLSEGKRSPEMLKPLFELRFASELGFMPDVLMCRRCMDHLPESIVFSVDEGCFWCSDCYNTINGDQNLYIDNVYPMKLSGLEMIRHITLTDQERLFNFKAGSETLRTVSKFSEAFVRCHMAVKPKSLDFYHSLERE
ncbi:MAG: DNA repair protein RecO [Ruminococcus sp.]